MTAAQLRKYLNEDAPLIIHVGSGRSFRVPHTDYAHLSPNQKLLVFFDTKDVVEVIRIASIESITLGKKQSAA